MKTYLLVALTAAPSTTGDETVQQGFPWQTLVMIAVLIGIFYFMIIRPQKKRDKSMAELRSSLSVGDEVVTIGGICGKVVNVKDDRVTILSGESKMSFLKNSIASVSKPEQEESETEE